MPLFEGPDVEFGEECLGARKLTSWGNCSQKEQRVWSGDPLAGHQYWNYNSHIALWSFVMPYSPIHSLLDRSCADSNGAYSEGQSKKRLHQHRRSEFNLLFRLLPFLPDRSGQ